MTERAPGVLMMGALPLWADRGDAMHMREVAMGLRRRGLRIHTMTLPGPAAPEGCDLPELRVRVPRRRFIFQAAWNVRATWAAVRAVRRHKLDVIYSRLNPGMIASLMVARLTRKPLVVEMNGLSTEDLRMFRARKIIIRIAHAWERLMYRSAKAIVAAPGYAKYAQDVFGVPPERFHVCPLGVDAELFRTMPTDECRRELGLASSPTVVWMGVMSPWQGLDTLIRAVPSVLQSVPKARIIIVGDGPCRAACQAQAAELGVLDAISFTGRVAHQEVATYINCADVCVGMFPEERGRVGTISALKTNAYMACARPVITTIMDELATHIQERGAGFAVAPNDPNALSERIVQLLTEPEPDRAERGRRAADIARENGDWSTTAERIEELIRRLMP